MKKLFASAIVLFCLQDLFAQVSFYKGEWSMVNKNDLFTGILKIDMAPDGSVKAEMVWTYLAVDSTSSELVEHYKGKKGKAGIEYAEGQFSAATNDINFEGKKADDPFAILGLDKYHIKLAYNRQAIYGSTETQGTNEGLLYAVKLPDAVGKKEFDAARAKIKNKSLLK